MLFNRTITQAYKNASQIKYHTKRYPNIPTKQQSIKPPSWKAVMLHVIIVTAMAVIDKICAMDKLVSTIKAIIVENTATRRTKNNIIGSVSSFRQSSLFMLDMCLCRYLYRDLYLCPYLFCVCLHFFATPVVHQYRNCSIFLPQSQLS